MLIDFYCILKFMGKKLTKILHLTRFAQVNKKGNIYFSAAFIGLPTHLATTLKSAGLNYVSAIE